MASNKAATAKGTRDFSPAEMQKRNYIFNTIRTVFEKYGYAEIQTPAFENLSTLTGKYGDEGDKLIFKILNSGAYLSKAPANLLHADGSAQLLPHISEKALRYDLTVPFARYVVQHQNDITFPFKRYQIQPVWRADRPQRGRYREFYQCDADVVGSASLINEAEFILIYNEVFTQLGLTDFTIKINNRKILSGMASLVGKPQLLVDMTVAIDKLDKIGYNGVVTELQAKGFTTDDIAILEPLINLQGTTAHKLTELRSLFVNDPVGTQGINEIESVIALTTAQSEGGLSAPLQLDVTLARGLNYYTGCIFEVSCNNVQIGSIGGGGRYDDLTGMFGLKGVSGAGISFGADRVYDVLDELNLFPESTAQTIQVLVANFGGNSELYALSVLARLRAEGVHAEIYPEAAKLKKQMAYADTRKANWVVLAGDTEMAQNTVEIKNMHSGQQQGGTVEGLMALVKGTL